MEAVILCGGLGTRLQTVVSDRPKVLASVSGRPFLEHQLDWLKAYGVTRVILATGHFSEQVRDYVASATPAGMQVTCSPEDSPLGTGGAIRHALPHMTQDTILVLNGDSLVDVDLKRFYEFHRSHTHGISIALTHVDDTRRYGRVDCDTEGQVTQFGEKSPNLTPGWINAGVYLMARSFISSLPETNFSFESDILSTNVAPPLYGYTECGDFIDIGTPEAYARASAFAEKFRSSEV